eukprot:GHVN01024306.1.p1 GENE.GHVN01024306.1~~GHVN01024306.1.p1  ORF type:complete len:731 (-),score=172.23 GHVN01024306.1:729-2921(-)
MNDPVLFYDPPGGAGHSKHPLTQYGMQAYIRPLRVELSYLRHTSSGAHVRFTELIGCFNLIGITEAELRWIIKCVFACLLARVVSDNRGEIHEGDVETRAGRVTWSVGGGSSNLKSHRGTAASLSLFSELVGIDAQEMREWVKNIGKAVDIVQSASRVDDDEVTPPQSPMELVCRLMYRYLFDWTIVKANTYLRTVMQAPESVSETIPANHIGEQLTLHLIEAPSAFASSQSLTFGGVCCQVVNSAIECQAFQDVNALKALLKREGIRALSEVDEVEEVWSDDWVRLFLLKHGLWRQASVNSPVSMLKSELGEAEGVRVNMDRVIAKMPGCPYRYTFRLSDFINASSPIDIVASSFKSLSKSTPAVRVLGGIVGIDEAHPSLASFTFTSVTDVLQPTALLQPTVIAKQSGNEEVRALSYVMAPAIVRLAAQWHASGLVLWMGLTEFNYRYENQIRLGGLKKSPPNPIPWNQCNGHDEFDEDTKSSEVGEVSEVSEMSEGDDKGRVTVSEVMELAGGCVKDLAEGRTGVFLTWDGVVLLEKREAEARKVVEALLALEDSRPKDKWRVVGGEAGEMWEDNATSLSPLASPLSPHFGRTDALSGVRKSSSSDESDDGSDGKRCEKLSKASDGKGVTGEKPEEGGKASCGEVEPKARDSLEVKGKGGNGKEDSGDDQRKGGKSEDVERGDDEGEVGELVTCVISSEGSVNDVVGEWVKTNKNGSWKGKVMYNED